MRSSPHPSAQADTEGPGTAFRVAFTAPHVDFPDRPAECARLIVTSGQRVLEGRAAKQAAVAGKA